MYCVGCLRTLAGYQPGMLPLCSTCSAEHQALPVEKRIEAGAAILGHVEAMRQNETIHRLEMTLSDVVREAAARTRRRG